MKMDDTKKIHLITQALLQADNGYKPVAIDQLHELLLNDIAEIYDTTSVTVANGQLSLTVTAVITITALKEMMP